MHKSIYNNLKIKNAINSAKILITLQNLHIVPYYRWCKRTLDNLRNLLKNLNIDYYIDSIGNVILNSTSETALEKKLNSGVIKCILQAHLDHPGAHVVSQISNCDNLWCARWCGGYRPSLEGRVLLAHDITNNYSENVKIEVDLSTSSDRFIYFRSKSKLSINYTILHQHDKLTNNDPLLISSWALDDLIGAAVIINTINQCKNENTLGLLTVGEEVGCYGLHSFVNEYFIKKNYQSPYFINIDVSAENKKEFKLGSGVYFRLNDKKATYTEKLVKHYIDMFPKVKTISSLKNGGTEAGTLVKEGYDAMSLVIPISYIHNGSIDGCFASEVVNKNDIDSLANLTINIASANKLNSNLKIGTLKDNLTINVYNHANDIYHKISNCNGYSDYLLNVKSYWNSILSAYGLPTIKLSLEDYDKLYAKIKTKSINIINENKLVTLTKKLFSKINDILDIDSNIIRKFDIRLCFLLNANFNACIIGKNIIFSMDKILKNNMQRLLCHELTHLILDRLNKENSNIQQIKFLLMEGIACYTSKTICGISSSEAMGINENKYKEYSKNELQLKQLFNSSVKGQLIKIIDNKKHRRFKLNTTYDPFTVSKDNKYNKYGYYLGMKFIEFCINKSFSISNILSNRNTLDEMLQYFLYSKDQLR